MENNKLLFLIALLIVSQLSACTWVKLTANGEKVRVYSVDNVSECKKVGRTTVSLKAKVIGIDRKKTHVAKELETLARNAGAGMDGDTVVPDSEIENGEQTFVVYKCLRES